MNDLKHPLQCRNLDVRFAKERVLEQVHLDIPEQKLTVIIGPNGSGKSTLLRSLARLQRPSKGEVLLRGQSVQSLQPRHLAQQLAVLSQASQAPEGIRVRELVQRGRTPYQRPWRQGTQADFDAVSHALEQTALTELADKRLDTLSGGQRQRAWVAMSLAQDTDILLLDEPTTFLDLTHQVDLLKLIRERIVDTGRTVVMVLHDINLASRFGDHLVAVVEGKVAVQGKPTEVVTAQNLKLIYALDATVILDPVHQTPHAIPH